jgi:hypothetical protein
MQEQFLKTATAYQLIDVFRHNLVPIPNFDRSRAMNWLKEYREKDYPFILGCLYDVAVYQVDGNGATEGCPKEDIGMFFASTNDGDFENAPEIPLQSTMVGCYRVACELLGLEKLFQRECELGELLPRHCHGPSQSISAIIPHIVVEVRTYETMDVNELHMKISEENGELAQAILAERGKLPGKVLKEPAMGEGADVIIATICALAKHYPNKSPDQLSAELAKWVNIKMDKYERKLRQKSDAPEALEPEVAVS